MTTERGDGLAVGGGRPGSDQAAPSIFERCSERDCADLMTAYPLAWVCTRDGDARHASLLPLLAEHDREGKLVSLLGHMARRNPLASALHRDPRALILFTGPQGYLSPELVADRDWAPTWNYAQLRVEADVHFDETGGDHALEMLVTAMEHTRSTPWTIKEMGPRYSGMARAIIAFRARAITMLGRFKLGQDEKIEILSEILRNRPHDDLSHWIRRLNKERLESMNASE